MTNLIESIQLVKVSAENEMATRNTKYFFGTNARYTKLFYEQHQIIKRVEAFLNSLMNKDANYKLGDREYTLDFFFLLDSLQTGKVRGLYLDVKSLRAEMLAITTPENLETFKRLNDFWEQIELSLGVLLK